MPERPESMAVRLRAGETLVGYFLLSGDAMIAELFGRLPLDWVVVDLEASPLDRRGTLHAVQAVSLGGAEPIIRVPWGQRHHIEHALDLGAAGVLVPKVDSGADAAAAADAFYLPPAGSRGINPVRASGYFEDVPGYLGSANERALCMVQVESAEAVRNVGEIAATEGVDVVFVGVGDLASSLGQPGVVEGPQMDRARAEVLEAVCAAGKVPGIFAYSMDLAHTYAAEGFRFIALGNEIKALRAQVEDAVAEFRRGGAPGSGPGGP
jgi:2-keto-3-deoxy-L-rhamnonate aldolase RhmA